MNTHTDLTDDLAEARKIQMGMLPADVPQLPGFEIAAHCTPPSAVGGDFYDFILLGQQRLGDFGPIPFTYGFRINNGERLS